MDKKDFKPFWKTCEFISTVIFMLGISIVHEMHPRLTTILLTASACIYALSRALFKQNRAPLIHDSHRTSELYVCIYAALFVGVMAWKHCVDYQVVFFCIAALQFTLVLARGYTKGHRAVKATVMNL